MEQQILLLFQTPPYPSQPQLSTGGHRAGWIPVLTPSPSSPALQPVLGTPVGPSSPAGKAQSQPRAALGQDGSHLPVASCSNICDLNLVVCLQRAAKSCNASQRSKPLIPLISQARRLTTDANTNIRKPTFEIKKILFCRSVKTAPRKDQHFQTLRDEKCVFPIIRIYI